MTSLMGLVIIFTSFTSTCATYQVGDMRQYNQLPASQKQGVEIDVHDSHKIVKRNAIKDKAYRWPGAVIPYEYDGTFSYREQRMVQRAMAIWSKYTCVSFRPARRADVDKIRIMDGDGCSSMVGMIDGTQELTLEKYGCRNVPTILHELGHAIGLYHTHSRPDRDRHLTVDLSGVDDENHYNFEKHTWEHVHHYGVKYDYHSIMHYGSKDLGDPSGKVIRTKDPKFQKVIGEAVILSFGDIEMVYKMYKCTPRSCKLKDADCPGVSFVDASCQCVCPGPNESQLVQPCQGATTTAPAETTTEEEETTSRNPDPDWTPEQTTTQEEVTSLGSNMDWTSQETTSEEEETTSRNPDPDWTPEQTTTQEEVTSRGSNTDWTSQETATDEEEVTTSMNLDPDWTPGDAMSTTESMADMFY